MILKIPDETFILMGTRWRVVKVNRMEDVDPDGVELLWGRCCSARREIRLYSGGDPFDMAQTFLHELVHAICKELGIKWEENESTVDTFSRTWLDTLERNGIVSIEED